MEKNKKNYRWLKETDYLTNMTVLSKLCYRLGIIRFKRQYLGGGYFTGVFGFVLYNPLTWFIFLLFFIVLFLVSLCQALYESYQEIKGIISEGVMVEIDRDYNSKIEDHGTNR